MSSFLDCLSASPDVENFFYIFSICPKIYLNANVYSENILWNFFPIDIYKFIFLSLFPPLETCHMRPHNIAFCCILYFLFTFWCVLYTQQNWLFLLLCCSFGMRLLVLLTQGLIRVQSIEYKWHVYLGVSKSDIFLQFSVYNFSSWMWVTKNLVPTNQNR